MSLQSFSILFTIISLLSMFPLNGQLIVQNEPITSIKGLTANMTRPEGIAFSPSGHCIAVNCSSRGSISLYKRIGSTGSLYETSPCSVLHHSKLLHYAHDIDFSPCGEYLAVACREAQKVLIYKINNLEIHNTPHCILDGQSSYIDSPASLSFSPCGEVLAVCNRKGGRGITFYRQIENRKGMYYPTPFYELTEQKLLEYGLSAPHGIAFSPDGKSVGVVHKRFIKNNNPMGESALAIFDRMEDPVDGVSYIPSFILFQGQTCLHSVDYHPSGNHLATTDEQFMVRLYSKKEQNQYEQSCEISIVLPGTCIEGPKGIAFSPDGKSLAITTMEPSILIYEINEFRH